jgi:hypothetical protein
MTQRQDFINNMMPHARRVGKEIGVDPRIIIAQAAQETGWGKSAPNNNYFGIKSHGKGGGSDQKTHEIVDGKRVNITDSFRGYDDMGASVEGYGDFLTSNPRYSGMLEAEDYETQLAALGDSGYATDPNYASSVGSIASGIEMGPDGPSMNPDGSINRGNQAGLDYKPSRGGVVGGQKPIGERAKGNNAKTKRDMPKRAGLGGKMDARKDFKRDNGYMQAPIGGKMQGKMADKLGGERMAGIGGGLMGLSDMLMDDDNAGMF